MTHPGHDHANCNRFWKRSVTRRRFMATSAGTAGMIFGSGLLMPDLVRGASPGGAIERLGGAMPQPIRGGVKTPFGVFIHHHPFPPGDLDPSEIGEFEGFIGALHATGTGTGTDTTTGKTTSLLFATDSGFISGNYTGMDGRMHRGDFAFI